MVSERKRGYIRMICLIEDSYNIRSSGHIKIFVQSVKELLDIVLQLFYYNISIYLV